MIVLLLCAIAFTLIEYMEYIVRYKNACYFPHFTALIHIPAQQVIGG